MRPEMTKLQVTLPDTANEFIEDQVSSGQFANPSEYLGFLVEQARATAAKQKLDDLLEEGLHSGPPIQFTPQWWQQRKAELLSILPAEPAE
jgi:antitoxin ParD1/3/4